MKLDPKALANASAIVAFIIYLLSLIAVVALPDLSFKIFSLTSHGLSVDSQRPSQIYIPQSILGGLLWASFVWIIFYTLALLYNRFRK